MREILFRAKAISSEFTQSVPCPHYGVKEGDWVEGYYTIENHCVCGGYEYCECDGYTEYLIHVDGRGYYAVDIKTLGQATGAKGKELCDIYDPPKMCKCDIFEGDIISHKKSKFVVFYDKDRCCFRMKMIYGGEFFKDMFSWENSMYEVIGNIHDNPELLEVSNAT